MTRNPIVGIAVAMSIWTLGASTASASMIFGDRFNRADGALGSNWSSTNLLGAPPATIVGQEVCGDDHTFGMFAGPFSANNVRTSFTFHAAAASDNFEVYATAHTATAIYLAGCDGANVATACTPKVGKAGGVTVSGPAIPMTAGTVYGMQAEFSASGQITVTITNSVGTALGSATIATGASFADYGAIIGRQADSNLTCIDNFTLEDLDDTVLFSDDFNRGDGTLGSNWGSIGSDELAIESQQACGIRPVSGPPAAYDAWVGEVSPGASITARTQFSNAVANDHSVGIIIANLSTKYVLSGIENDGGGLFLSVATGVPGMAPSAACTQSSHFTLSAGATYELTVRIDPDGTTIATIIDVMSTMTVAEVDCDTGGGDYGSVVLSAGGQVIGGKTCTDNFVIYAQEPATDPVDCVVSSFGACSASCGGGTQTRTIITPPANGGAACPALSQACNTQPCESPSFVPTTKDFLKCEQGVVKSAGKLQACLVKCQAAEAADASGDEAACATGCRTKYDDSATKLTDKGTCPTCLGTTVAQAVPADTTESSAAAIESSVYCAATPSATELKCEASIGKALLKLGLCLDKCQGKTAGALLANKTFDGTLCKAGCRAKFDKGSGKLVAGGTCPSCLGATQQASLADGVATERNDNFGTFFCEGTTPIP